MDIPPPERSREADLAARIRTLWGRAFLLCPPMWRRGIQRFRSMEEANEERARATRERMRQRAGGP